MIRTNYLEQLSDLYIGSYAPAAQQSIFRYRFDPEQARLTLVSSMNGIENPSFIRCSLDGKVLFAISEKKEGSDSSMTSFCLNGDLTPLRLSEVTYKGAGACYIGVDSRRRYAVSANYLGGTLAVLPIDDMGKLSAPVQLLSFTGVGPNKARQAQSHIHSAVFSLDEQFLYIADLGADRVYTYQYHPLSDRPLSAADPPYAMLPGGMGPRHMAVHSSGLWLYVLCELSGDLFVFNSDVPQNWLHRYSVASENADGKAEAADLKIDRGGRYLYASNRGQADEIFVFRIDALNGALQQLQHIHCGGKGPRCLAIDPSGAYLLSANEKGNSVTGFRISPRNGTLDYLGVLAEINAPTSLQFIPVGD